MEKKHVNQYMNIELTSYIDNKQNVWSKGKDFAKILGYSNTKRQYEHTLMNMINNEYLLLMSADPKWVRWLQVVVYAHILTSLVFTPLY